jgi:hypothetical protein
MLDEQEYLWERGLSRRAALGLGAAALSTGSWLGKRFQSHGLGTEMRAAVLAVTFAGLRAGAAVRGAYSYNAGSLRVSEKLGYERNGVRVDNVRGAPAEAVLFRLTRERWYGAARPAVDIDGLAGCSELFGAGGREPRLVSVSAS